MIAAGRLRDEVTIETPTRSQNTGTGAVTNTWSVYTTTRAEVLSLAGSEGFEGDAAVARATYQVTIRYLAGVTAAMRILWEGQTLYILSVVPDGRRREMVIQCTQNLSRAV